ncbi:MAG: glycine/D-amino acid oxidase-like deaminating enzyme [Candidatus Aldehydirespiratoraceae bacterium]|jgi:glycine/D-amino acid oxidase-like deaminating enzyme
MPGYADLSLWLSSPSLDLAPRPSLDGDADVDVAIVGGGFTGLWTAYYLTQLDPSLKVMVIEREVCGFGASGRNGGWCVGELPAGIETYTSHASHEAALRQARDLFATVDEVGRVAAAEGIDCGYTKGGVVRWARNRPQAERQAAEIEHARSEGFTEDEVRLLSPDEARSFGAASNVHSGVFFAACAAIDPARLVRGLADVVEQRGVRIVEQTAATAVGSGHVATDKGTVRAGAVVRATEAYTRDLKGERRTLVPIYSLMIATEPLDGATLAAVGLESRATFADDRYMVVYGQRTEDGRIAFGGRGVPYAFGSGISPALENNRRAHDLIHRTLVEILPDLADVEITHRWGGVLAAPRNWTPSLWFDQATGFGSAGGYIGEGVAAANLAGRTMADLITETPSERSTHPWVGIRSRKWEPEPARWLGIRGTRAVMDRADNHEYAKDSASKIGRAAYQFLR